MLHKEVMIKSDKLKRKSTDWDKYALVQWLCQNKNCMATIMLHEVRGENFEPVCPLCASNPLVWNKVYAADVGGNVTE
jgi:hypothetical protein